LKTKILLSVHQLGLIIFPLFSTQKNKRIGNKILMIREKSWPELWHYPNHGQLTITNHYNLAQRSHQRLTNQVVVVQSYFWDPQNQAFGLLPWAPMHMRNQTLGHYGGPWTSGPIYGGKKEKTIRWWNTWRVYGTTVPHHSRFFFFHRGSHDSMVKHGLIMIHVAPIYYSHNNRYLYSFNMLN
jgi:hypothetical protein